MLIVLENLRKLEEELSLLKKDQKIIDYRLILKLNMSAALYIVSDDTTEVVVPKPDGENIEVEMISPEDFQDDDYYQSLFERTSPFDLGLRRSLSNMIDDTGDTAGPVTCPIVSFYSYKGGVGRTTALALFASYFAIHYGKKVFIIDCDFEAPGLINFFEVANEELPKNGIVEYIIDKQVGKEQADLREGYTYEISKRYSGVNM